jgi:hypothetical protein
MEIKSEISSMLIIVFDIKGIVHRELVQQAKQSMMFYGDCVKI